MSFKIVFKWNLYGTVHKCGFCKKSFTKKLNTIFHERNHTVEKSFVTSHSQEDIDIKELLESLWKDTWVKYLTRVQCLTNFFVGTSSWPNGRALRQNWNVDCMKERTPEKNTLHLFVMWCEGKKDPQVWFLPETCYIRVFLQKPHLWDDCLKGGVMLFLLQGTLRLRCWICFTLQNAFKM